MGCKMTVIENYQKSLLQDHQGLRNKNLDTLKTDKWTLRGLLSWAPVLNSATTFFIAFLNHRSILCRIIDAIINLRFGAVQRLEMSSPKISFFSNIHIIQLYYLFTTSSRHLLIYVQFQPQLHFILSTLFHMVNQYQYFMFEIHIIYIMNI